MLPLRIFMTDRHRLPDWKEVLATLPLGTGVIFRDYDAPDRKKMAQEAAAQEEQMQNEQMMNMAEKAVAPVAHAFAQLTTGIPVWPIS